MDSWWEFGEDVGYRGDQLELYRVTCAFCRESGNFDRLQQLQKNQAGGSKVLNYEVLRCGNCGNLMMVFWSAGHSLYDLKTVPWPIGHYKAPEFWPSDVARFWLQAKNSLSGKNWDAAALMARSALQLALRSKSAVGKSLKAEIDDLARKGLLPPIMQEWSNEVRELGNDSAHPAPGGPATTQQDAADVVRFMDSLLEYLFTLPHRIEQYRSRKKADQD